MGAEEGAVIKDEHETPITNVESFAKVLQKYGMKKTREKKKHRVSYALAGAEFDIDNYDEIPAFLEIEETSRENINFWMRKLNLENHDILL
jgi:predicted adenylyl cyclase CyaB